MQSPASLGYWVVSVAWTTRQSVNCSKTASKTATTKNFNSGQLFVYGPQNATKVRIETVGVDLSYNTKITVTSSIGEKYDTNKIEEHR